MTLTILSVASPYAPVDPDSGATDGLMVAALDAALVRAGHRSLVIGVEGSAVSGSLIPLPRVAGAVNQRARGIVAKRVAATIASTLERHPVDLVHLHLEDFPVCLPATGLPTLVTLHRPLDDYPADVLTPDRPDVWLTGLSAWQMRDAPPAAPLLPPIEIGVAVDRLYIRIPKRNFVVGLGSVDPDSGFDLALEAAHASDMQLVLSGEVPATAEARSYFQDVIRPRLDQRRRFLGPIGFARKRWMLGAARCLISPRRSVEPTSLAALEALACGTPVVGYPAGPLPGIVEPGVTGFLAEDVEGFVKAVEAAATIDPDACRAAARTRHSIDVMAERYLTLYDDLAMGREPAVGVA